MAGKNTLASIQELWRGASSQPPWKRVPGQVEDALNVRLDIARGAVGRIPLEFKRNLVHSQIVDRNLNLGLTGGLEILPGGDPLEQGGQYHFSSIRELLVCIGRMPDTDETPFVSAWLHDGTPVLVVLVDSPFLYATDGDGNPIVDDPSLEYIAFDANNTRTATSFDTMLVLNREQVPGPVAGWSFLQSYAYIRRCNEYDQDDIVAENPNGYVVGSGLGPPVPGSEHNSDTLFEAEEAGPWTNGDVIRVLQDSGSDPAGFYLYYDLVPDGAYPARDIDAPHSLLINGADEIFERHGSAGYFWRVPDGRNNGLLSSDGIDPDDDNHGQALASLIGGNYPLRLVYSEAGPVLYVTRSPYRFRLSGSLLSNAFPRQQAIRDVRFFQNRTVFGMPDSLAFSRANDYFNFYLNNVAVSADDDAFVQTVGQESVGMVQRMEIAGPKLMVLAEAGQMEFGAIDANLTSSNGQLALVTRFRLRDLRSGTAPNVVTAIDEQLNVHEWRYLGQDVGVAYTSQLNIHDKKRWFTRDPAAIFHVGRLMYVPDTELVDLLAHEIFHLGDEEVQSAWCRLSTRGRMLYADEWFQRHRWIIEDTENDLITLAHYTHEETEPPTDATYWFSLDLWERVEGVYSSAENITRFNHTGRSGELETSRLVLMESTRLHEIVTPTLVETDGTVVFRGNLGPQSTANPHGLENTPYLGFAYEKFLELSKLFVGMSAQVVLCPRFYVFHEETTDYDAIFVFPDGTSRRSSWKSDVAGVTQLGVPNPTTFFSEHNPAGDLRTMRVRLLNSGAGRATWTGIQYEVDVKAIGL